MWSQALTVCCALGLSACETRFELFEEVPRLGVGGQLPMGAMGGAGGAPVIACGTGTVEAPPLNVTGSWLVTNSFESVTLLDVASGAGLHGVTWVDTRDGNSEIYFQRPTVEGTLSMNDLRITEDASLSFAPSVVYANGGFNIAWKDERFGNSEIMLARVDAATRAVSDAVRVTESTAASEAPSLVWTGTELTLAWYEQVDGLAQVFTLSLSTSGQPLALPTRRTTSPAGAQVPALGYGPGGFGLLWQDGRHGALDVFFRAFDETFEPVSEELALTSGGAAHLEPRLSSTDDTYAAVWKSSQGSFFVCLDAAGRPGPVVELPPAQLGYAGIDIASLGDQSLLVLRDDVGAQFARFDGQGRMMDAPTRLHTGVVEAVAVSAAGDQFGVFVATPRSVLLYRLVP